MKFHRVFLNRLQGEPPPADTVVVIDVLRSFTTAAVALARGARAVWPVAEIAAGAALARALRRTVSVGAVAGGDPVPGFDYGNSPAQLAAADLSGCAVVLSTAAGVRGLQRFRRARRLYAGSMVCAAATAAAIRAAGAEEVALVITGEWLDRDGDEDVACADYLAALLSGRQADPAALARRVRESDFGRRFGHRRYPHLPLADLELAASLDRFDFAMPVRRRGGYLVIR